MKIEYTAYDMGGAHVFDAHDRGRNVGYVATFDRVDHVWLDELYVDPSHRGRGLGRELMNRAVQCHRDQEIRLKPEPYGRDAGPSAEQLTSFYEGFGFRAHDDYMVRPADTTAGQPGDRAGATAGGGAS